MPDDPLVALALRLTDGESIDWKAESQAGSVDLALLQILKQIEAVARAHEGVDTPNQGDAAFTVVDGPFWGHLQIIELIGAGSCGDVYRARDTRLGRDVALKLLRTRDAIKSESTSLVREGHLLSRVRHANVVTVHGADCVNGQTGLWMELIEGETLEQEVRRRGAFPTDEVAQIGAVLCDALEAVHSVGLLHRDVKAQNVMRERGGRLVLMDFGSGHEAQRFAASTVEGTPLYAAPEVLNGSAASVQSDIYSLGVLLWYLLTVSYPVNGRSVNEIRRAHARGRIAKPPCSWADGALVRIAVECLAIDSRKRPPNAGELGKRLRACSPPSGPRRRAIRNSIGLGLFAAAVLLLSTAPLSLAFKREAPSPGATDEPVWSFAGTPSGAPSSDGRYFACYGFESPVAICDVTAGIVRRIPITERWREVFNARPLISPNGQRLVYHGLDLEEAKIVDLPTLTSKTLRVDSSFFLKVIDWRASGDSLLVLLLPVGGGLGSSVALLEIDTGTLTNLKRFDATPDSVALSHDGSRLVFTQRGDLYISDLESGETRHIAGASNVHGSLLFMPNDDGVLFTSGDPASDLLLMRLADGRPIGEIEVLRHSSGLYFSLLGVSDAGDVYYNSNRVSPQPTTLHIAPFDTATQQIGTPAAVAMLASGLSMDWSPDSKSIAYARSDETKPTIVIRDAATALEHKIQLPDDSIASPYHKSVRLIRWSPQGKILANASGRNYLIDPDETSVRRLELTRDPLLISAEWASDGWTVLYQSVGSLRGVDVGTGLQTESHTLPEFLGPVEMSPQQRLVAFSKPQGRLSEIDISSLDDGVPGPLVVTDRRCRPAGWWHREVFVACDNDSNKPNVSPLYLVDVGSGTMKTTHVNLQEIEHVRVRPDGRAIAITAGLRKAGTFALKIPRR